MAICNCQARRGYRTRGCVLRAALAGLACVLTACASPQQHSARIARRAQFQSQLIAGRGFQHQAYVALRDSDMLVVFIEGDGSPWVEGGRAMASDPTARVPLALELAALTPLSILYLGRPCYLLAVRPPECSERLWTAERYSQQVVDSMVVATDSYARAHGFARVLLVGYSGGATLATLMADKVPRTVGVVSIAGNLDPDSWARLHGYLPLEGSLNPALRPPLPAELRQWYLVGLRDTNVPAAATERYLRRVPADRIRSWPDFDHVCCWKRAWPTILREILGELNAQVPPSAAKTMESN